MTDADEILFDRRGGLGLVTLNRPKALNTLSLAMYRSFDPRLVAWAEDPRVHAVVVRGAGGRAFCAGGDVVAIYKARAATGDGDYKADFFREEYILIQRVHRFPKPYVALVDGVTMGGGAGISINGSHCVATERTLMAMPEVLIGLFPDVGATRFLNRCPGRIGLYLGLTGARIGAADALYCGLATHYVPHERLDDLVSALAATEWRAERARDQVDAVLARFGADPGPATLAALRPAIDRCFAFGSIEEIMTALRREEGEWAWAALAAMERASPLSLKVVFRQLQLGLGMEIEAALALEYRLTQHFMAAHDFFEGIRAVLVDKDQKPRWQHPNLAVIGEDEAEGYFATLGERELLFEPAGAAGKRA